MDDKPLFRHQKQASLPGFESDTQAGAENTASADCRDSTFWNHQAPEVKEGAEHSTESIAGREVWALDVHSLLHQLFHALPEMSSPRGEPVGAVFGFARDLLFILEEKRPDYLFCAFDMPGKTFRHEMFEAYKAGRVEMPDDLLPQIALAHRLISVFGIPALGCETFEADDVLATLAKIVQEQGGKCVLVTSDKDCRQLISEQVRLYNIRKDEFFDALRLREEWGIMPEQVVDFQALVGDAVDNVPGVPLIGPKFARQLLEKFGTLEAVFHHAAEVPGEKRRDNLLRFKDQALLSRALVRLKSDVPLQVDWQAGRAGRIDLAAARELFRELGFRSLERKLLEIAEKIRPTSRQEVASRPAAKAEQQKLAAVEPAVSSTARLRPKILVVDTPEALARFTALLRAQKSFALDTETTDIRPRWAKLVGLSFCWNESEAWYLPLRTPDGERHLDADQAIALLEPILEDPNLGKVGQNLKYDMIVLRNVGVKLQGLSFDTMLADYLLEAGRRSHSLDELAQVYLQHETIKISDLIGGGKAAKKMDEVSVARIAEYAGQDAWLPWRLRPILAGKLAEAGLNDLFEKLELPLVKVLAEMEFVGVKVDVARLAELDQRYTERMAALEEEIYRLAGRRLNISSPKQLQELLFDELKLPVVKRTAKTGPSTDAEVLEELAASHPLPAKILEYRQFAKLKGTYIDALPAMICPETGRIHASFHQTVTATGRLSSSEPNLQNIPIRTEEGREIRSAFVPEEGWLLLSADYSQIELRVLAHFSGDPQLQEAFAADEDIHARVAAQIAGVPLEKVTPEMRRAAKAVNFGVIYGQGPVGLARSLGIPERQAADFIDDYFKQYPGIEGFLRKILAECRETGYAKTILGRRRAISGIREGAGRQRNLAERTAVNTVIQGSAADLIKKAMLAVFRRMNSLGLTARLLLQNHDELIFEVPPHELRRLAEIVNEEMSQAVAMSVPLKVELKAGANWAEVEKISLH